MKIALSDRLILAQGAVATLTSAEASHLTADLNRIQGRLEELESLMGEVEKQLEAAREREGRKAVPEEANFDPRLDEYLIERCWRAAGGAIRGNQEDVFTMSRERLLPYLYGLYRQIFEWRQNAQANAENAERYLWLRNESWAGYNHAKGKPEAVTLIVTRDGAGNVTSLLAEDALDQAVDQARGVAKA